MPAPKHSWHWVVQLHFGHGRRVAGRVAVAATENDPIPLHWGQRPVPAHAGQISDAMIVASVREDRVAKPLTADSPS